MDADSVDAEMLYPTPDLWDAITQARGRRASGWSARGPTTTGSLTSAATTRTGSSAWPSSRPPASTTLARSSFAASTSWTSAERASTRGRAAAPVRRTRASTPFWEVANETPVPVSLHYGFGATAARAPTAGITAGHEAADGRTPLLPMAAAECSTASRTCKWCSHTATPAGPSTGWSSSTSTTFANASASSPCSSDKMCSRASTSASTSGSPCSRTAQR